VHWSTFTYPASGNRRGPFLLSHDRAMPPCRFAVLGFAAGRPFSFHAGTKGRGDAHLPSRSSPFPIGLSYVAEIIRSRPLSHLDSPPSWTTTSTGPDCRCPLSIGRGIGVATLWLREQSPAAQSAFRSRAMSSHAEQHSFIFHRADPICAAFASLSPRGKSYLEGPQHRPHSIHGRISLCSRGGRPWLLFSRCFPGTESTTNSRKACP